MMSYMEKTFREDKKECAGCKLHGGMNLNGVQVVKAADLFLFA